MDPTGPCRTIQNHKWPERTRKSHKGPHNASPSLPCVGLSHCPALHCRSCFTTENNDLPSLPVLDCHTVEHHTIAPALLQNIIVLPNLPVLDCCTIEHCTVAHVLRQKTMLYPACLCWTVALLNIALLLLHYYRTYCFTQPLSVGLSHCQTLHCCSCLTTIHNVLSSLSLLDCRNVTLLQACAGLLSSLRLKGLRHTYLKLKRHEYLLSLKHVMWPYL